MMWPFTKPKKEPVWKLVGQTQASYSTTGEKHKTIITCLFYMTDDGGRRIEFTPSIYNSQIEQRGDKLWREATIWQRGGHFPDNMEPIDDTLGPMLKRLMDRALLGENE